MKKLNILKCGDQFGWAYHFLTLEQAKYSKHNIRYAKYDEVMQHIDWADIIYIHSPDITKWHAIDLPLIAHEKGKKVITQYSGNPNFWSKNEIPVYSYSDLVVTISPQLYQFAKNHYYDIPIIYLPESVDSDFFVPNAYRWVKNKFIVGWAGGIHKKIKRGYLLKELDFPIQVQDTWKNNRYNVDNGKEVNLEQMKDFYQSIDCLVVTSLSECMPRVVMEAMACGLPVIGTDVGSMRILLDRKFIVPTNPEDETIKKMNSILHILNDDYSYRCFIGNMNRVKCHEFFSWQKNAALWDEVFDNVYNEEGEKTVHISKNWSNKFKDEFNDTIAKIPKKSDTLADMEIKDVIRYLNDNRIDYYLLETSCLDCIRYQKLQKEKDSLYIGGDLSNINNVLLRCGFKKNNDTYKRKNINIILKDININQTKIMPFYNLQVHVPYPVVSYLISVFGTDWKIK